MKDIIWTLIIFWLIYKIVDVFKSASKTKNINSKTQIIEPVSEGKNAQVPDDMEIKSAVKKHLNNEGDYVDFEEIK